MDWTKLKPLNLSNIKMIDFPEDKYFREEFAKKQVVLHHTVSGPGIRGDLDTWLANPHRVATCIIIDRDGTPNQMFPSKFWGYHTGRGASIDKHSIGIEFDSWGGLILKNGNFHTVYGNKVNVLATRYADGFRGYEYYESYTDEQIRTAGELILLWRDRYGIPMDYKDDMWDISQKARSGEPGVWTHVSYQPASTKQDCHPQPELISMLKSLSACQP